MPQVRPAVLLSIVALLAVALLVPGVAQVAFAGGGEQPAPPDDDSDAPEPATALRAMRYFLGDWDCTGRNSSPESDSYPVAADAQVEWVAGRSWLRLTLTERATEDNPEPLAGVWLWGYEPDTDRYTAFFFDSLGNRTEQYAPGWRDGGLRFEGRIVGPDFEAPYRDVITRQGADAFRIRGQGYLLNEWVTFQRLDCQR